MRIRSADEVARIRAAVERVCEPLGKPVDVIVNYDGFRLDDEVAADYAQMVADLDDRLYRTVTRYSGSAFLRMKLGETLRGGATHLFESRAQAQAFLDRGNEA
jgi:propionate CoA-transferase